MSPGPLRCIDCRTAHAADVARCLCGGALDNAKPLSLPTKDDLAPSAQRGVWRHAHLLGVPEGSITSLGEGDTPLVHDADLGVHLKMESMQPTGSFKDRGATVVVSMARALGHDAVVEDSSGNAGTSVAAYAARAGMRCDIFAPASITQAKRQQIETLGAGLHVVDGPRGGVTEAAADHAELTGAYYASHTYPPHFVEGCTTLAYELVRDLGGPPSTIVTPSAMGSVLIGCHRGFTRLHEAGCIDAVPRLVAVQAAGYDPLVRELGGSSADGSNELADGLLIPAPPRLSQMVDAVEGTGGTAISVTERSTVGAMEVLHRRGHLVEPSSATALAGLQALRTMGELDDDGPTVLVMTGRWKGAVGR